MGINGKNYMRQIFLSGVTTVLLLFLAGISFATDPPHTTAELVSCNKCHTLHKAPGGSLTNQASNENLCLSCHNPAGIASAKPFTSAEGSVSPGVYGRNHNWIGAMPVTSNPSNTYGLRAVVDLKNANLKARLAVFNNVVVCSVCHNQHKQSAVPWDPSSSPAYTSGVTSNRHFMRENDNKNELCEDCHYYRAMTYTKADGEDSLYPADGVNVFGHSTGDTLNHLGYDNSAPLDFDGGPQQTPPRYKDNSSTEPSTTAGANITNNLILDSETKVRCLSCHKIHNVDSNGLTPDTFSGQ